MLLVVLAELLFGVEKSSRREENRVRLQRFAAGVSVLPFDVALAARYAVVRAEVERKGRSAARRAKKIGTSSIRAASGSRKQWRS